MKITKQRLREIIKEELSKLNEEKELYDTQVGDYLVISVPSDGYDISVDNHGDQPQADLGYKSYMTSLKALVQVVKVAEGDPEDY